MEKVNINNRTKGEWYISHSPVRTSSVSGKVFKSVKSSKGIGGHIIANCFSTGPNSIMNVNKAKEEAEANAAYIVKACNNHDALVSALEKTYKEIEDTIGSNLTPKLCFEIKQLLNSL